MLNFIDNETRRLKFSKFFWIFVFWFVLNFVTVLFEYMILIHHHAVPSNYSVLTILTVSSIATLFAAITGGYILVFVINKWIQQQSYGTVLLRILMWFTIIYFVVATFGLSIVEYISSPVQFFSTEHFNEIFHELFSLNFLRMYVTWLIITLLTLLGLQINDKYGPGVFWNFIQGKYYRPKKEQRIFMFVDLKSSTSIAESLGESKYFQLLKDFFQDATTPIIDSKGEIYQYVGDEIVVSWALSNGVRNDNCINCYFEIAKTIRLNADHYLKEYGLIPEFKAGMHFGNVMSGEIGVIKRDIAFSGDVLNTASRIQGKCNELGVNILLSKLLLDNLKLDSSSFSPVKIGDILLRGKTEKVILYTL